MIYQFATIFLLTILSCQHTTSKPNPSKNIQKRISSKSLQLTTQVYSLSEIWDEILNQNQDENHQFKVLEVGGDGDCFFYSVATALSSSIQDFFGLTANDLRLKLANKISQDSYLLIAEQMRYGLVPELRPDDDIVGILNDAEGDIRGPQLLQAIIQKMASDGPYRFVSRGREFALNYWGDLYALKFFSDEFDTIRFLTLKHDEPSFGEPPQGSGCVLKDQPNQEREKMFNLLLYWSGGHYQLVGQERQIEGSFKVESKPFQILFENKDLSPRIKTFYRDQCNYLIPE